MAKNAYLKLTFFSLAAAFVVLIILSGPAKQSFEIKNYAPASAISAMKIAKITLGHEETLQGEIEDKIHLLLLGIAGEGKAGAYLTDTIISAEIIPKEKKITLISIPRDFMVRIPQTEYFTKINSLYSYNHNRIDLLKQATEQITAIKTDYYILIDLDGLKKIVDEVGGINVLVPEDIYDPQFPGANHSYEPFFIKQGWRYFDGETALKYVRTRHDSKGDFGRIIRQQQIIIALKNKVLELNPLWDFSTFIAVFNAIESHVKTDLKPQELKRLWNIIKEINIKDARVETIDKENLLSGGQIMMGGQKASVLVPKAGKEEYGEIRSFIKNVLSQ